MVHVMTARFAVVLHSSGVAGGYVVRTVTDGSIAAPYSVHDVLSLHSNEANAQLHADMRNEPLFGRREPDTSIPTDHQVRDILARMEGWS